MSEQFRNADIDAGLTKREEFAKAAMIGYLSVFADPGTLIPDNETVARRSVELADALLAELAKTDAI